MIFPTADELMIDDELIEYCFPSNPLHVRIRGTGHPVLQSYPQVAQAHYASPEQHYPT